MQCSLPARITPHFLYAFLNAFCFYDLDFFHLRFLQKDTRTGLNQALLFLPKVEALTNYRIFTKIKERKCVGIQHRLITQCQLEP